MVLLETTFLIDIMRGEKEAYSLWKQLENTEPNLNAAAPSVMELWLGAQLSTASAREKEKVKQLLESLEVIPLTKKSAIASAEIEAALHKKGLPIQTEDCMIAGIALTSGETVVTRDEHYARIPGLRIIKY